MDADRNNSGIVSHSGRENDRKSTHDRLIESVRTAWDEREIDAISVRLIASEAGCAPSAIGYHFGDLERLYHIAAEAAATDARRWAEQMLDRFEGFGDHAPCDAACDAARAGIIATAICQWCTDGRPLALARRRSRAIGFTGFERDWRDFWHRLARLIGLERHAATLALFADGEAARHLLDWDRVLDRLLLEETARALVDWLARGRTRPGPMRAQHSRLAVRAYDRPAARRDEAARPILDAAADLLAEQGHRGLTFRAIAGRAGVTLGMVVHHCGTRGELLRDALHRLYEREAMREEAGGLAGLSFAPEDMIDSILEAVGSAANPVLKAYDEIELAVYNDPRFTGLRGLVRSMDDPSGAWTLGQITHLERPPAPLVAAFSATVRGIGFMTACDGTLRGRSRDYARAGLAAFAR